MLGLLALRAGPTGLRGLSAPFRPAAGKYTAVVPYGPAFFCVWPTALWPLVGGPGPRPSMLRIPGPYGPLYPGLEAWGAIRAQGP